MHQVFRLLILSSFSKANARPLTNPTGNDFFQPLKCATADKQNVSRIDLDKVLMRMFATTLRRHIYNRAFDNLQQSLLDALARNISGDRWVVRLSRNFVNFIHKHNARLGSSYVEIGSLKQAQQDVFDIFPNVSSFG